MSSVPIQAVNFPNLSEDSSKTSKLKAGAIAGGVVGGVLAIALAAFIIICCRRRRKSLRTEGVGRKGGKEGGARLGDIEPWTTDGSGDYLLRSSSAVPSPYSNSSVSDGDSRTSYTSRLESSVSPEASASTAPNQPEKGRYRPLHRPDERDTPPIFRKPRLETNGARSAAQRDRERRSEGAESGGIPEIVAREVAELRWEIAQIRNEQGSREGVSPPSYDGL